jgi:hypothetical protein
MPAPGGIWICTANHGATGNMTFTTLNDAQSHIVANPTHVVTVALGQV